MTVRLTVAQAVVRFLANQWTVNIEHEDAELGQIEGLELAARTRQEVAGR